ncbi:unnamed protein product [Didymodactylos carnosus]|uniref:Aminotransferase class I/classII large domain-containing protein n=1 Tax=Didymodactylos carnosus TaxID=1234261 RepID=A0A815B346_9BILA|nr:unnamed protein product [Didymodactylos carnosus]CAF1265627.1 unnamed protein product [Didymodactylos carnosus]CAF3806871.1 unnamed protein product [Didymodactylos carnosus]CAF4048183.1 unnamed protein product [Didymodactylos carnosus]
METLSTRGKLLSESLAYIIPYFVKLKLNPFDEIINPNGILNLAVAENVLCENILVEKLKSIQTWAPEYNYYPNPCGEYNLRTELCKFFQNVFQLNRVELKPERMLITNGAAGAFSVYSYMLGDIGDVFLISSPYYTTIDHNVAVLTQNTVVRCPLLDQDKGLFRLTVDVYRQGYLSTIERGLKPKAIILVNPQNPLGDIYEEETLRSILEFACEKKLHVIVDEVYALSVFKLPTQAHFQSVLNYKSLPDPERTHFLWSFSKDFSLPGIRIGVLYSGTAEMCMIAQKINFLMVPSKFVQETITTLLSDNEWVKEYLKINQQRLTQKFFYVKEQLEVISNQRIEVYQSKSGFYIWANFRRLLKVKTFDEEMKLFNVLFDNGVFISRGFDLGCSEPGWFRIIFSLKDSWISEGINRLKLAFDRY